MEPTKPTKSTQKTGENKHSPAVPTIKCKRNLIFDETSPINPNLRNSIKCCDSLLTFIKCGLIKK